MLYVPKRRIFLIGALLAMAGLTTGCETNAERQARLEREAFMKTVDVEELKKQLNTVNPDPYAPGEKGTRKIGRAKQN
jgi:hypothetical protein